LHKTIIITALLALCIASNAQEIKKVKATDLESYIKKADHPLIVNFWATYCVPCMEEMPTFVNITNMHKREGLELLLVSLDMPSYYPDKIAQFAKEKRLPPGLLWLAETNADYFCPKIDTQWSGAIPATLFINHKTGYHKFLEQQISPVQLQGILSEMLDPTKGRQNSTTLNRAAN
jgi:thiol-disulfide isomerase/thioredoxin